MKWFSSSIVCCLLAYACVYGLDDFSSCLPGKLSAPFFLNFSASLEKKLIYIFMSMTDWQKIESYMCYCYHRKQYRICIVCAFLKIPLATSREQKPKKYCSCFPDHSCREWGCYHTAIALCLNWDQFTKFVLCPVCESLYTFKQCYTTNPVTKAKRSPFLFSFPFPARLVLRQSKKRLNISQNFDISLYSSFFNNLKAQETDLLSTCMYLMSKVAIMLLKILPVLPG